VSRRILQAAELAKAVYDLSTPDGLGIVGIERIEHAPTDTSGMAYHAPYGTTIAFAGSASKQDWLTNANIKKRPCYGWIKAHAGFADCAEAVLGKCLEVAQLNNNPLTLTGHSQGGAVALLVAIGLASRLKGEGRSITVITFGQPRVSTEAEIRACLPGEYIRVVNGSDVVTRVPRIGYGHAGTEVYLRNNGGYCVDPGWHEKLTDRLLAWQHDRVADHMMAGYLKQLQQIL
jgi:hypothetical protein